MQDDPPQKDGDLSDMLDGAPTTPPNPYGEQGQPCGTLMPLMCLAGGLSRCFNFDSCDYLRPLPFTLDTVTMDNTAALPPAITPYRFTFHPSHGAIGVISAHGGLSFNPC